MRFDVHCHLFNYRNVPDGFIGFRVPLSRRLMLRTGPLFRWVSPLFPTIRIELQNMDCFLRQLFLSSPEIAEETRVRQPAVDVFCPLLMDMAPSIRGHVQSDYEEQIAQMEALCRRWPGRFLPFLCLNPRNPRMTDLYERCFQRESVFHGVKVYPSLGYFPSHPALMEVFHDCVFRQIPVTAHCSDATVHYNRSILLTDLHRTFLRDGQRRVVTDWLLGTGKRKFNRLNAPATWDPVLAQLPDLRLNLAHFGGDAQWNRFLRGHPDNWVTDIVQLMRRYAGVYADVSYTAFTADFHRPLIGLMEEETVRDRVLYGSDDYIAVLKGDTMQRQSEFEAAMGQERMRRISSENPARFLGISG